MHVTLYQTLNLTDAMYMYVYIYTSWNVGGSLVELGNCSY